jgi:hypothetical protein
MLNHARDLAFLYEKVAQEILVDFIASFKYLKITTARNTPDWYRQPNLSNSLLSSLLKLAYIMVS